MPRPRESTRTGVQNHKRFSRLKKIPDGLLDSASDPPKYSLAQNLFSYSDLAGNSAGSPFQAKHSRKKILDRCGRRRGRRRILKEGPIRFVATRQFPPAGLHRWTDD